MKAGRLRKDLMRRHRGALGVTADSMVPWGSFLMAQRGTKLLRDLDETIPRHSFPGDSVDPREFRASASSGSRQETPQGPTLFFIRVGRVRSADSTLTLERSQDILEGI